MIGSLDGTGVCRAACQMCIHGRSAVRCLNSVEIDGCSREAGAGRVSYKSKSYAVDKKCRLDMRSWLFKAEVRLLHMWLYCALGL